ncbi:MAG: TetR family transcriptional regulator [Steroidobacteraceae bacterium]|nr:TetR family transcriptional regulator [Steroidobacteraceae bacterium]
MAANFESRAELRPTGSKLDLINATVAAISRHGLSEVTSAKIARAAGHTAASINFHFGSKEALLLATLREVSEEFADVMTTILEEAGGDDLRGLLGIIDASLSRRLSDSQKIAVWYAFLAESNARADYQRICGERDQAYSRTVTGLCKRLIADRAAASWPDAEAVSLGLTGLIDQQWQGILFEGDNFDREAARRQCRAYLCSVFPWLAGRIEATAQVRARPAAPEAVVSADRSLRYTLPAWVYHSEEFHELEKERIFLPSWQVVCHVSELPTTGDFVSFEFFGQRGFVVRDDSGALRAFHNVCSHRAHAVVSGERGRCGKFLTCMYHGWTYHLDGRNRSVSAPDTFPKFDRSKFGLKPIELEVFMGMVFVRFRPGEDSVTGRMAPHQAELAHYRMDQMVPLDELWTRELEIDWKNVVENYVEDYHFPIGHPGLSALMEPQYDREVQPGGTMRLSHRMRATPLKSWSAERYARFLPVIEHLPEDMRRRWTYLGLFPNVYFDIYPEWLDFFQILPLGPGRTLIRARSYGFPDDRREMKAARFLCARLNARVQAEDEVLTRSVQRGLSAGAYTQGILSDKEIVLAGFQDWIRARLPVTQLIQAPARGSVAAQNAALAF